MNARPFAILAALGILGILAWALRRGGGSGGYVGIEFPTVYDLLGQPAPSPAVTVPAPMSAARGIRNNNPGNVRISASPWLGKVPVAQNTDGAFEQFTDAKYGLRVVAYLLLRYQRDKGKRTVRALISEPGGWAPSSTDNNPAGYADYVARAMGLRAGDAVDLFAPNDSLYRMVQAIVKFENGGTDPYGLEAYAWAIASAREAVRL